GRHALDLLAAGAAAVALGTILFADPGAPARVRAELGQEAGASGYAHPGDAVGVAHLRIVAKRGDKAAKTVALAGKI
ncbi:MAG TPA: hypothetical protein VG079_05790, partial [Gaiellaceae bacterium]|nr:hypothetical protein [Gaiellaceae bacterium]